MMLNTKNQSLLTTVIIWLIILFSFFNFSAWYYPLLEPATAVGILMSPGFSLPGDLYMWGQNQYGSLIPLLSNILILTYLFPAALAFSVTHFGVLIAGYFAISSLFRSKHIKIMLALVWFLPAWHFHDQVVSPAGIMMSTLGIGIWLLNYSLRNASSLWRNINLSLACIAFIISIWVYDDAALTLLLILAVAIWRLIPLYKRHNLKVLLESRDTRNRMIITLLWALAGLAFILYSKHKAIVIQAPVDFISGSPVTGISVFLSDLFSSITDVLLYKDGNIFASLHSWLLIAMFFWILSYSKRKKRIIPYLRKNKWFVLFAINAAGMMILEILSRRFYASFTGSVYGAVIYVSFWMAFFLYIESTRSEKRNRRITLLYIVIIPGAISSFISFYIPYEVPSRLRMVSELKQLDNAGIIASYKDAYTIACADPKRIHATPHDSDLILNRDVIPGIFKQQALYIIRDGWMAGYPDTLRQFGQILLKRGPEFTSGGYDLCRYDRYIYSQIFTEGQMKFQGTVEADEDALSGRSVKIDTSFDRSKHFIFGPFIPLNTGKIKVEYRVKGGDNLSTSPAAVFEVSADFGKVILGTKTIRWSDFQKKSHFETFDMIVDIPKDYKGVEFRIMFLGGNDMWFDQVVMTGM